MQKICDCGQPVLPTPNDGGPTRWNGKFVLENDPGAVGPIVLFLQEKTRILGLRKQEIDSVGIALEEALLNSIHHGNLEVSSLLRERDGNAFFDMIDQRRVEIPYRERRVLLRANFCQHEAVFQIRDEGPGFCALDLPDPTDPDNLERLGGRGILLMREFMDEVQYNDKGNEVRLVKRR